MTVSSNVKTFFLAAASTTLIACGGGGGSSSSGGLTSAPVSQWSISEDFIQDGGPGKDGIPSIDSPTFTTIELADSYMEDGDLVVVARIDNEVRAYPHKILDWHEVVNDSSASGDFVLSYCPLTGTSMAWNIDANTGATEFGVSGLLYNSNLIMYDRTTDSYWAQMLMQSARGSKRGAQATQIFSYELVWHDFKMLHPEGVVLSENTGFSRNYNAYPYGSFRTNTSLLFEVNNSTDIRLHPKQRVLGVKIGNSAKAYTIQEFGSEFDVINDEVGGTPVAIVGKAPARLAVAFERTMEDGSVLTFSGLADSLPAVVVDNEGNEWDITGMAISGPRVGTQLKMPFSYASYWYAWTSFFPQTSIYE